MSTAFTQMLSIISRGMLNYHCDINVVNWNQIISLAREQGMLPMLWCSVKDLNTCPDDIKKSITTESRSMIIQHRFRKIAIISLMNEMEAVGIPTKVIKGFSLAECYAQPDARISGDVDLLITPSTEGAALAFLKKRGFHIEPRNSSFYHSCCHHPDFGMIELHIDLFSDYAKSIWFKDVDLNNLIDQKASYVVNCDDGQFHSLQPTSHLLFLFLHMFNHFVNLGASIRQFIDIASYYSLHMHEVDHSKLKTMLAQVRGESLFDMIILVAERYCGLKFPIWEKTTVDEELLTAVLNDIEQGGHLGNKKYNARLQSRNQSMKSRVITNQGTLSYVLKLLHIKLKRVRHYFLPNWYQLCSANPAIKEHIYQLPLAWFKHIRKELLNYRIRRKDIQEQIEGPHRTLLLEELGLL